MVQADQRRVDTLFGALERWGEHAEPGRRTLTGLRNGEEWVELSYEDLLSDIVRVSAHLADLGLGRGDVICLVLPNWTEAVIYTYAASRIGAVVCPVTTIYRRRELGFVLERTHCKVVVVPSVYRGFEYAAMVSEMAADLPDLTTIVSVGDNQEPGVVSSKELLATTPTPVEPADVTVDDVAVLAFTSGTTGESKGVMHSHATMHAVIDDLVEHAGFGGGLTSLVMSPFGHLTGFTWGILMPLRGGGDVVLLESWDPEKALDLVDRYRVTFTMGATPFLNDLLERAGKRARVVFPDVFVCGGAPIPPSLVERAVQRFGCRVVAVWGMSEYCVGTATAVQDEPVLASTSDGRPVGSADVKVVDPEGNPVAVGEEGDLIIRGPGRFLGYYKRPDIDAGSLTTDGYLKTGDRARLLDERGHIRICGRTKDIIIRGGENIPVVEIENILVTHPDIKDVALVPLPHERLGETACACVVLQPNASGLTVEDLGAFLGAHDVAKQFWPEAVRVLSEFPRTPSGKIQKFALRERALS
ncbi:AMP-binding protein [Nocardioides sp. NBC_00850]|uniref:AMP-binding protein n=1 Tax=Nocardioides sp. NBC_00850 TaxID=2976001 RepID=UPI00387018D6|nr:AMP-binding protein [Nocardioides sp. NBC_00850]